MTDEVEKLKKDVAYWKAKYEFKYQSWLSLRDVYNREVRENNTPEIRAIKASQKSYLA